MPEDSVFGAIRTILLEALGALDAPPSFSALLAIPLSQPGKVLGKSGRVTWVQSVLATCEAAGGDPTIGAWVAAAVECVMASLDLLDEIEDGDASPTVSAVGMPQALNAATALLLFGQRLLLNMPSRDGLPSPTDLVRTLTDNCLTATVGQHRDLSSGGYAVTTSEEVVLIARRKAGALARAACRLGAMIGTSDQALLELYGRWGEHFGTASQLANDLHDALDSTEKSDLAQRKSTLPLIFQHRFASDTGRTLDVPESGALHFTWVVVELERQRCRDIADELAARGQFVAPLRRIVS